VDKRGAGTKKQNIKNTSARTGLWEQEISNSGLNHAYMSFAQQENVSIAQQVQVASTTRFRCFEFCCSLSPTIAFCHPQLSRKGKLTIYLISNSFCHFHFQRFLLHQMLKLNDSKEKKIMPEITQFNSCERESVTGRIRRQGQVSPY
jgi:hypothetical protein